MRTESAELAPALQPRIAAAYILREVYTYVLYDQIPSDKCTTSTYNAAMRRLLHTYYLGLTPKALTR